MQRARSSASRVVSSTSDVSSSHAVSDASALDDSKPPIDATTFRRLKPSELYIPRPQSAASFSSGSTKCKWSSVKATAIEASLMETLDRFAESDKFGRLGAYRFAFDEYIQLVDPGARSLLLKVKSAYEKAYVHEYKANFDELFERLRVAEAAASTAVAEVERQNATISSLKLEMQTLERQLYGRNEQLAEIGAACKINVNNVNWISGVEKKWGKQSMAEIRAVNRKKLFGKATGKLATSTNGRPDNATPPPGEAEEEIDFDELPMPLSASMNPKSSKGAPNSSQDASRMAGASLARKSIAPVAMDPDALDRRQMTTDEVYVESQRINNLGVPLEDMPT